MIPVKHSNMHLRMQKDWQKLALVLKAAAWVSYPSRSYFNDQNMSHTQVQSQWSGKLFSAKQQCQRREVDKQFWTNLPQWGGALWIFRFICLLFALNFTAFFKFGTFYFHKVHSHFLPRFSNKLLIIFFVIYLNLLFEKEIILFIKSGPSMTFFKIISEFWDAVFPWK